MVKRRGLLILVICLIIVGVVGLYASSMVEGDWRQLFISNQQENSDLPTANHTLTVYQLVQTIANATRAAETIADAYADIPAKQKDGLTLDQFQQYIILLRRGLPGTISSFSAMSGSEIKSVQQQVLARLPGEPLAEELVGFWIHYQETGRGEAKFAIFVQQNADSLPYLSSEWIERIISLSDLSTLYFDAIDKNDTAALAALLKDESSSQKILELKAQRIIDFYRGNISTRTDDFQITHVRIDSIGFIEYGITNLDLTESDSRTIELLFSSDGHFKINDTIPDVLSDQDVQILVNDELLLPFVSIDEGQPPEVRSGNIEKVSGEPILHDDSTCTVLSTGVYLMKLQYQSLDMQIEGTCYNHKRWNGQITWIKLFDSTCSLGSGLRPGMTTEAVLEIFPFADETNFVIKGLYSKGLATLNIVIRNGVVASLELTWASD